MPYTQYYISEKTTTTTEKKEKTKWTKTKNRNEKCHEPFETSEHTKTVQTHNVVQKTKCCYLNDIMILLYVLLSGIEWCPFERLRAFLYPNSFLFTLHTCTHWREKKTKQNYLFIRHNSCTMFDEHTYTNSLHPLHRHHSYTQQPIWQYKAL